MKSILASTKIKSLEGFILQDDIPKIMSQILELSTLPIVAFSPLHRFQKEDLLLRLLRNVLPLTSHHDLNLKYQCEQFLIHLYSLLSSFYPTYLFNLCLNLDTVQLQPEAQASIFSFLTITLRYVSPIDRSDYFGTCHSLLICCKPDLLKIHDEDWEILNEILLPNSYVSITKFLINTPLKKPISLLLKKDKSLLNILWKDGSIQFIKEMIPFIENDLKLDNDLIMERFETILNGNNSSDISGVIEILQLLIRKSQTTNQKWISVFENLEKLWLNGATISQKAAIIDLFVYAINNDNMSIDCLEQIICYDEKLPTTLLLSILDATALYITKKKKIPKGFIKCITDIIIERDPLPFDKVLRCLSICFNDLYKIAPIKTEKIFDLCINNISKYFVEQISLINLLQNINYQQFPLSKFRTSIDNIIYEIISEPHYLVIDEVKKLIKLLNVNILYTILDWFENSSLYIQLFQKIDAKFVLELLDLNLFPPAFFPNAIESIINNMDKSIGEDLFSCALYVVYISLNNLGIQVNGNIQKIMKKNWSSICRIFPQLLSGINDNLPNTTFGKIIDSCIKLLSSTVEYICLNQSQCLILISIASVYATAFTVNTCSFIKNLNLKYGNDKKVRASFISYFSQSFQYKYAELISLTSLDCLDDKEIVKNYFMIAANSNRKILSQLKEINTKYNTFLFFKNIQNKKDYILDCSNSIPFYQWDIQEDDVGFIHDFFEKITIDDINLLDENHMSIVKKYPELFIINEKFDKEPKIKYKLSSNIKIGQFNNEFEIDEINENANDKKQICFPDSPYSGIQPSKYIYLPFLWFSNKKVSNLEQYEEYLLSSNDYKMILGFFGYAIRNESHIDIEKWVHIIKVNRNDKFSLYSFIYLLYFIHKPWNELTTDENKLITNSLIELGVYDISPLNLINEFHQASGIKKYVIESIIRIDPQRYEEYNLIQYLFISREEFLNKIDEILQKTQESPIETTIYEFQYIFSNKLFNNIVNEDIELFNFPRVKFMESKISTKIEPLPYSQVEIDFTIIEKIFAFFENNRNFDNFLFTLLFHINLTQEQFQKLYSLIEKYYIGTKYYSFYLLTKINYYQTVQFSNFEPPSYIREIIQFYVSPYFPETITSKDLEKLLLKTNSVPFNLLFKGFETLGNIYDDLNYKINFENILLTKINIPNVNEIVKANLSNIYTCKRIAGVLYNFKEEKLLKKFNFNSKEAISDILTYSLIKQNYLTDVIKLSKLIIENSNKKKLLFTFSRKELLNASEFKNIFILLKIYQKYTENDPELKSTWEQMINVMNHVMSNKDNLDLIISSNIEDALPKVIFSE